MTRISGTIQILFDVDEASEQQIQAFNDELLDTIRFNWNQEVRYIAKDTGLDIKDLEPIYLDELNY